MFAITSNTNKLIATVLAVTFLASALIFSSGTAKASPEGRDFVLGLGAIIVDKMIEAEERKQDAEEDYEPDTNDRHPDREEDQDEEYNDEEPQDDQY